MLLGIFRSLGSAWLISSCWAFFDRTSLGFVLDTIDMSYDIPERRLAKLESLAERVLQAKSGVRAVTIAQLTGQIWSMQPALGLICRLRCRYLTLCMLPAARAQQYGMVVHLVDRAREETTLWARSLRQLPRMPLQTHLRRADVVLECDASATAVAAIVVKISEGMVAEGSEIHRELSWRERHWSSCLREMVGYAHAVKALLHRHGAKLRGKCMEIVGDSKAASCVFANGGSQRADEDTGELLILEALLDILGAGEAGGFEVIFRWVKRDMIKGADALSKVVDRMDFSLAPDVFDYIALKYGPFDVDRFAAPHNAKCVRFNTLYDTPGTEAVDAFAQDWRVGVSFVLGDFNRLDQIMDIIERDNAAALLLLPEWLKHRFWRRSQSGAWQRRVLGSEFLDGGVLVASAENASRCFFGERFKSRILVMRVGPIEVAEASFVPQVRRPQAKRGSRAGKYRSNSRAATAPLVDEPDAGVSILPSG